MNKKQSLTLGIIGAVCISSIIIINYLYEENIKEQEFNEKHLKKILDKCDYLKRMDERDWIGFDGNYITDLQLLYVPWQNSTHYIDNNICEFIPLY